MKKPITYAIVLSMLFCLPLFLCNQVPIVNASLIGFFYPLIFGLAFYAFAFFSIICFGFAMFRLVCKRKLSTFSILPPIIFLIMAANYCFLDRVLLRGLPMGSNLMKFDSNLWKSDEAEQGGLDLISAREKMLKDLIVNVLPGKTKAQIEELLGPSLETQYFKSIDNDMIYHMGLQRDSALAIDSEWLLIWLDNNDKFQKYKLVSD